MGDRTADVVAGFVAGVLATGCMSGLSSAITRMQRPEGAATGTAGPKHYELVGMKLAKAIHGEDKELDVATRVRLGEALHFVFGGVAGVGFIKLEDRLAISPALRGTLYGASLWAGAFAGYFPLLKISEGVWAWDREDVVRSFRAHMAYGNSVMLMTRGWKAVVG